MADVAGRGDEPKVEQAPDLGGGQGDGVGSAGAWRVGSTGCGFGGGADGEDREGEDGEDGEPVPAGPTTDLVVVQPDVGLRRLAAFLDLSRGPFTPSPADIRCHQRDPSPATARSSIVLTNRR